MSSPPEGGQPERPPRRERLTPPPVARTTSTPTAPDGGRGLPGWWLAVAVIATVAIILVLPRLAKKVEDTAPTQRAESIGEPEQPTTKAPRETAMERAGQLQAATALLVEAEAAKERVAGRAPELWAAEAFLAANTWLDEGRRSLDEDRPARAREALEAAVAAYREIGADADAASESELAATRAAIEAVDPERAAASLARASAITPGHDEHANLQDRVDRLPRLRELLERGRVAEREQRWERAETAYAEALAIDAATTRARQGLKRARAQLAEQRFRGALADVTNALDAGELDRAAPALERARSLRPKAAELGPLSTRLAEAVTRRDAATLAAQARELESKERWADALAKHEAALALNPHLATSLSARARCSTRAALQERIEGHLSRSDRLSAAAVLDEARALLAEARTVEPAGPEHRALTERLAEVIAGAAQPIAVTLVSDGVTEVTVHRVGRLGSFERRTLELVPGTYTVTGRRPGYRDVRQQLVVKAETLPPQLPVRCDERI